MPARHLVLLSLLAPCAALRVDAPAEGGKQRCSLAFASHSGFGNQVVGTLKALFIAEALGCRLLMPPILSHWELAYGPEEYCQGYLAKEREMIAAANKVYRKGAHLSFDAVFKLNPGFGFQTDLAGMTVLPHHCDLFKWMNQSVGAYSRYMGIYMRSTTPPPEGGNFTIGSGYRAGTPGFDKQLYFDRAFLDLSDDLRRATSAVQDQIAEKTGSRKGRYACLHVRNPDGATVLDGEAEAWVRDLVEGGLPLYLMSASSSKSMRRAASKVCEASGCVTSDETLPAGLKIDSRKRLFLEMAVCAMAEVTYLPNTGLVIREGNLHDAGRRAGGGSTLQWTIRMMSQMPLLHRRAKKDKAAGQHLADFVACGANPAQLCEGDESVESEEEDVGDDLY